MTRKRNRKRKLSIKKISIFITLIILTTVFLLNINNIKNIYLSKITGYNKDTIEVFLETDTYNQIKNHEYSKTLETILNTDYYNKKYIKEYLDIKYLENDNFLKNTNTLLDKGYTSKDINNIYDKLSQESINILLDNNYIKDITNIISISYFHEDNLERYIKYYEKEELDVETILTYVNIGLDNSYYTNVTNIENQNDILVLVNKYNKLSNDYVPSDLETINAKYQWYGRSNQLRKDARIAFEEMCEAAINDNIYIYAGSGYRSYKTQLYLYNNYVSRDGFAAAETYSARASYSEHQTGLAMDIANKTDFISEGDKEYDWLINNSYKYGFILRYPKNKEKITGFMYEEWHYRYVGKETAKEVYESNLTYDEFMAKK